MEPGDQEAFPEPVRIPPACRRMEQQILLKLLEYCDDIEEWPWRTIEEVIGATADHILALDSLASLANKRLSPTQRRVCRGREHRLRVLPAEHCDQYVTP